MSLDANARNPSQSPSGAPVQEAPNKEATTNSKKGSMVEAEYEPGPTLYFRPETGEFILVPANEVTALENECRRMDKIVEDFHKANEKFDAKLEELAKFKNPQIGDEPQVRQARSELDKAIKEQQEAQHKLKEEIKPLAKMDTPHSKLVELIPIFKDKQGKEKRVFKKTTTTYVAASKVKNSWEKYVPEGFAPLKGTSKEKESGQKSFLKPDGNGGNKIDKDKLQKGLTEVKSKFKLKFAEHEVTGVLFGWAESWNKNLKYDFASSNPDSKLANNVDLKAEAQMMRYLAGVGLESEWEPKKGKCSIKGSARAEFAVAEAKASAALFMPDKLGWVWVMDGDDGKSYPMGAFRAKVELALTGMVGASLVVEAGVAIDYKDETRKELGLKGSAVKGAGMQARELKVRGKPLDPGASAEAEAFAGAKADLKLCGAFQWLNPENAKKEFDDFAVVSPAVSGMLGAGAGFMLEVTYAAGKFRFRCMASACLGVGAKGKVEFEVNVHVIMEFIKWFAYQLYHANYRKLEFVTKAGFDAMTQLHLLVIAGVKKAEDFAVDVALQIGNAIDQTADDINTIFTNYILALEKEEKRVQLMERILENPRLLLYATPEAKGIMLYQLSRHDWTTDGLDSRNHAAGRYYGSRKDAVKLILRQAQTRRDYDNIIQHMTSKGTKGDLAKNRKHVMNFLDMSLIGDANDDEQMLDFYNQLHAMLKLEPTRGFPMVANNDFAYKLQRDGIGDHPMYANLIGTNMPNLA
jgi:hypothetical protein